MNMKEGNPIGLTRQAPNPTLEIRRVIFMPGEPGGGEIPQGPRGPLNRTEKLKRGVPGTPGKPVFADEAPNQSIEQLREAARESWTKLYGKDLSSLQSDERQTVEAAIGLGYGPSDKAGKSAESPEVKEVIANSSLSEQDRTSRAEELLHRKLLPKQREAILKAHTEGAGVFRNSAPQLAEKVRILKDAGFSTEEIRTIMESGLAAMTPPPLAGNPGDGGEDSERANIHPNAEVAAEIIDTTGISNAGILKEIEVANVLANASGLADVELIGATLERIVRLNAPSAEKALAVERLSALQRQTIARIRAAREESGNRYFSGDEERAILTNEEERERVFEEIFTGVDANPGVEFLRGLSFEAQGKLDHFFTILNQAKFFDADGLEITDPAELARKREQLHHEFSGRREIRRILHDANYSATGGGDIQAFVGAMSTFQSEYIDLIFQDPLVSTALHMYEQAFQQIKAENGGRLPYEELAWNYKTKSSNLEDRVWALMRRGVGIGDNPNMPEWRLRRAIILARGFGVASLRFPEITAQARLPEETPFSSSTENASRFGSIYGEALARYLDPLEHIIEKFSVGQENRAFLYFFLTGDKKQFQSKEQLRLALEMKSHLTGDDKRLVDLVNIFRIGGGFSNSSWRSFMSMRGFTPEQRRRSGLGILEGRASGDVDDEIRAAVKTEFAGRSEEEMAKEIERRLKGSEKKGMMRERRIAMWKDALKANPLRIMWQWEEKSPGQRLSFLREALGPGISESDARDLLPKIEQDLMIIQENTVRRLGLPAGDPNRVTYEDPEMLDYSIIGDETRRGQIRAYVARIRTEALRPDPKYKNPEGRDRSFVESLFDKTDAQQGSPFPFVIGFEDIPFSDFDFINTGGRGFARRINDYAQSVTAVNELTELIAKMPTVQSVEPLTESLFKIKSAVDQYDPEISKVVIPYLSRGIVRMFDKDLVSRLPLGIGTIASLLRDSSFAQTVYGREAPAWSEGDKFNFTRHLMRNKLVTKDEIKKIRKDVGATPANLGIDIVRTYGQLAMLIFLYSVAKSVASDK